MIRKILNHWGKINRIFIPRMRQEKMRDLKKRKEKGEKEAKEQEIKCGKEEQERNVRLLTHNK